MRTNSFDSKFIDNLDPSFWDNWLSEAGKAAGFRQTCAWAEINSIINGDSNFVDIIERDSQIVAATLMSLRRPSSDGFISMIKIQLRNILRSRGGGTLDCRDGPVVNVQGNTDDLESLLEKIEVRARRLGVDAINFHGAPITSSVAIDPEYRSVFERRGYDESLWLTSVVDLSLNEEALFNNCNRSVRKAVRKCEREDLRVIECTNERVFRERFLAIVFASKGMVSNSLEMERRAELFRVGYPDYFRFFVAESVEGKVLGVLGTYRFNGTVMETTSVLTEQAKELKLPAQDALHWHIIKAHHEAGDLWFDLAGYSPEPQTIKEEGIRRFKRKWGGKEHTILRYAKILT